MIATIGIAFFASVIAVALRSVVRFREDQHVSKVNLDYYERLYGKTGRKW